MHVKGKVELADPACLTAASSWWPDEWTHDTGSVHMAHSCLKTAVATGQEEEEEDAQQGRAGCASPAGAQQAAARRAAAGGGPGPGRPDPRCPCLAWLSESRARTNMALC